MCYIALYKFIVLVLDLDDIEYVATYALKCFADSEGVKQLTIDYVDRPVLAPYLDRPSTRGLLYIIVVVARKPVQFS